MTSLVAHVTALDDPSDHSDIDEGSEALAPNLNSLLVRGATLAAGG
jgi:hypothetical protein